MAIVAGLEKDDDHGEHWFGPGYRRIMVMGDVVSCQDHWKRILETVPVDP